MELLGGWEHENGCYYSNDTYKPMKTYAKPFTPKWEFEGVDIMPELELYPICADCLDVYDCKEFGAFCHSEKMAEETVKGYFGELPRHKDVKLWTA